MFKLKLKLLVNTILCANLTDVKEIVILLQNVKAFTCSKMRKKYNI